MGSGVVGFVVEMVIGESREGGNGGCVAPQAC